ncbi:ABC transporter permease [Pseudonocardia sp. TRM90224]|uniref:ABC transporter permease n=1 Tax=Pseudonocardia sp. TRM90224 TaxID=2812678 RepID=UPI001E2F91A6|nr:ABC transporter permease [Pseudonocardia sp. TRM90224]
MTTLAYTVRDSRTMLRRNVRRMLRYPSLTAMVIGIPVVLLLLFVFVFGGTLGAGIDAAPGGGRTEYANYVVPGILLMTLAGAVQGTAISISMDMTEGIVARFRTMAISRAAVLTGHVIGSVIQSAIGVVVVLAVAFAIGFRPTAGPLEWLGAVAVLLMAALALIWLAVALGLKAKSVETASNTPMFLILLPFLGSGFVPTDSMPVALALFAEYQPFTPIIETLRGLLRGTPIGASGVLAVVWCVVIAGGGYLWSRRLYERASVRPRA